jgi:hypothetical protein
MRGVGGVTAAGEAVEMHLGQFGLQPPLQARHVCYSQISLVFNGRPCFENG